MSLKREFVELSRGDGINLSELCRRYGISRPTGYKWIRRWLEEGREGLRERPRRPQGCRHQTPAPVERQILAVRAEHPVWGGRKIRRRLQDLGVKTPPSASTITAVLRRHGELHPDPVRVPVRPWRRFERPAPNDLWQMDFKGHFAAGDGRCHPLTVLDDRSRFNVILGACANQRGPTVRARLRDAFGRYGLPAQILCDNSQPWGVPDRSAGYTALGVWLLELGIEILHGRPRHPQTQGKDERFHRTLQAEVISRRTVWRDLGHCSRAFARWRESYNHERPHESLDDEVPASVYRPSPRQLPEPVEAIEGHYLAGDEVRRVRSKGEIMFRGKPIYVGQAFAGKVVALRPKRGGAWELYFGWKKLGEADLHADMETRRALALR